MDVMDRIPALHGHELRSDNLMNRANGNRPSVIRAGIATTYAYDHADQLTTKTIGGGSPAAFVYDTYGNLTTSQTDSTGATTYTYDAADSLMSSDPPGASNTVSFALDALGRNETRSVNGFVVDTYGYIGESETVDALTRSSGTITSAVDANSDRLAISQSSTLGWTLPDLHGSMAAMLSPTGSAVSDAFRYDPFGDSAGTSTSGPSSPWHFNGDLLLTDPGTSDLYDMGARSYDPALAAFTQEDSVGGQAQNPFSLNRYVFAWANPMGMVDPSGHMAVFGDDVCASCGHGNAVNDAQAQHAAASEQHHADLTNIARRLAATREANKRRAALIAANGGGRSHVADLAKKSVQAKLPVTASDDLRETRTQAALAARAVKEREAAAGARDAGTILRGMAVTTFWAKLLAKMLNYPTVEAMKEDFDGIPAAHFDTDFGENGYVMVPKGFKGLSPKALTDIGVDLGVTREDLQNYRQGGGGTASSASELSGGGGGAGEERDR